MRRDEIHGRIAEACGRVAVDGATCSGMVNFLCGLFDAQLALDPGTVSRIERRWDLTIQLLPRGWGLRWGRRIDYAPRLRSFTWTLLVIQAVRWEIDVP